MKRLCALILCLSAVLTGCGGGERREQQDGGQEPVELSIFAGASLTETLGEIKERYRWEAPNVSLVFHFGSSGDLTRQIQEGAECDVFLSAAPAQMDQLDGALRDDPARNPGGLNLLMADSRVDLLENRVVLAAPHGNPKGVESFDHLAALLRSGDVLLAIGGGDEPIGQYTRRIFDYYNLNEEAVASCLSYGANVKEVTAQVEEAAVDCGILFATDAFSARLQTVEEAGSSLCGQVVYSGAVLADSAHRVEALEFLDYLSGEEATAVFSWVGFTPLAAGTP